MSFDTLFSPSSIAVIGASAKSGSVGNDVIRNLHAQGYKGHIYPVNPKKEPVMGLTTYPTIQSIGMPIDLAVVIIPAPLVPQILQDIAEAGTKSVVIISAGFKETGEAGAKLEEEIKTIAKNKELTVIGPNCLGVINPHTSLNISFAKVPARVGNVSFISQSGALCSSVLDYADEYGIGFAKFVSVGNKTCLDEGALLTYLASDIETKVILMYIESLTNVESFVKQVRAVSSGPNRKPIIALKAGRTASGAVASSSHTGALAGNFATYEALFKQTGIIGVDTVEDLFVYAEAFAHNGPLVGNRIAIVTNAGGPGVLVADEAEHNGLVLAQFSKQTLDALTKALPPAASVRNPVDVLGDAQSDRYQKALDAVADDSQVDGIIAVLTPQSMTDVERIAISVSNTKLRSGKPVVASFMGSKSIREGDRMLQRHTVANMLFPESAARAMAAMYGYSKKGMGIEKQNFDRPPIQVHVEPARRVMEECISKGYSYIPEAYALRILEEYGFPTLSHHILTSRQDSELASRVIQEPVALKVISKDIVHKTEVGGVELNVAPKDIPTIYDTILARVAEKAPQAKIEGVLMAEMAPRDGFEFVLGVKKDATFGAHLLMFGMGGIYVEVLKDISFRLAPLTYQDAYELIREVKSYAFIKGARGKPVLDEESLITCILMLSQFVTDFPQMQELDINPLLVLPKGQGVRVLDARILIG